MDEYQKVVLITGAASGIGWETATLFAKHGYAVALVDRDAKNGKEREKILKKGGCKSLFISADVSSETDAEAALETVRDYFGKLDVAFNNAGIEIENAPLADCSAETFDKVMAVNLRGVYLFMKYEIQLMLGQKEGGHIINTASAAGLIAAPRRAAYTASKHAVVGLTKAAALEYARQRLHINAICPGVIETDMYRRAMEEDPKAKDALESALPMGRAGKVSEVAETVFWLSQDASRYIQGHALPIEGGLLAT